MTNGLCSILRNEEKRMEIGAQTCQQLLLKSHQQTPNKQGSRLACLLGTEKRGGQGKMAPAVSFREKQASPSAALSSSPDLCASPDSQSPLGSYCKAPGDCGTLERMRSLQQHIKATSAVSPPWSVWPVVLWPHLSSAHLQPLLGQPVALFSLSALGCLGAGQQN